MMALPVWRLVRNPYGRIVWEGLERLELKFSKMNHLVADLSAAVPERAPPPGLELSVRDAMDVGLPSRMTRDERESGDRVVVAFDGHAAVGCQYISLGREYYVAPLERTVAFDAYLWGIYVDPDYRNHGLGKALVVHALRACRDDHGVEAAHTLVGIDNVPSMRMLAGCGFEARKRHTLYKVRGFEHRDVRDLTC